MSIDLEHPDHGLWSNVVITLFTHSPDKNKPTVQTLQAFSDVWHYGKESVDVRLKKSAFARVQKYFPECSIIVDNLEVHVQAAEVKMFPRKKTEQNAWMRTVVQSVLPNVSIYASTCCSSLNVKKKMVCDQRLTWVLWKPGNSTETKQLHACHNIYVYLSLP